MRKTGTSCCITKLKTMKSKDTKDAVQSYKKGLFSFNSCIVPIQKYHITPTQEEIFEQACSTTFTSKIFEFSNCESKDPSSVISPIKSLSQIQHKKKKLNVMASLRKMKTQAIELANPNLHSTVQSIQFKDQSPWNCQNLSTNEKIKIYITQINPQNSFDQKQGILKKLRGKKPSQSKHPNIQKFSEEINDKILFSETAKKTENKTQQDIQLNKFYLKENCTALKSYKKISHIKKRNIQLKSCQNDDFDNLRQKIKTETEGDWIILRQNYDFSSSFNKWELVETPINKLLEEDEQLSLKKQKFFRHD